MVESLKLFGNSAISSQPPRDLKRAFRAKSGDVKLAVLSTLEVNHSSGYQLIIKIKERSGGEWRLSSGSFYPQLEDLTRRGYIQRIPFTGINGVRVYSYSLTNAGRSQIITDKSKIEAMWACFTKAEPAPFSGTALELELNLLEQALSVVGSASEPSLIKIEQGVARLRRLIYSILAE